MDFGCGVGRVTLPLARRAQSVVAVDVADTMLALTRALLDKHDVRNVLVIKSDDKLLLDQAPFDLVHSVLVLQHVPTSRGLWLTKRLVELTADDGSAVLHLLYHNRGVRSLPVRIAARSVRRLRRFRGKLPEIQMNPYPLNDVFKIIQDAGVRRTQVEFTNHAGHLGATVLFRKIGDCRWCMNAWPPSRRVRAGR